MFHRFYNRSDNNRPRLSQSEVVISVVILLVFILLAIPFFTRMLENFERTALQQIVRQLNAAANFKMAEYVGLDKLRELPEEIRRNPVNWVNWVNIEKLGGWNRYLGEVERLDFDQLDGQHWVFDKSVNRLIYKVDYPELLINGDPISNRIQFRVRMDYIDFDRNGRFDAANDTINGLVIEAVYPYQWKKRNDE